MRRADAAWFSCTHEARRVGQFLSLREPAARRRRRGTAAPKRTCNRQHLLHLTRSRAATRGSVRGKVGPNAAQPNTAVEAAACGDGDTGDAGTAYGFAKPALAA